MADDDFKKVLDAAEDAACWAKVAADTINLAAWGENNTESGPAWVSMHSHTVESLCAHIEALVQLARQWGPRAQP